jgi:DNA-binding PadR family transcriptional regulator
MSLKYGLLGLLAQAPRHGYELKQEFEQSFSGMRQLNIGQIYTTLARLTKDGLVQSRLVEQEKNPARKIYRLTDAGQTALADWLETPVEDNFEQVRNEFFHKLLVHALVTGNPTVSGDNSAERLIERQRVQFEQSLDILRRQRLKTMVVTGPGAIDPRTPAEQEESEIRLLLVEGAILHLEADLEWLDLLAKRLERLFVRRSNPLWYEYHARKGEQPVTDGEV